MRGPRTFGQTLATALQSNLSVRALSFEPSRGTKKRYEASSERIPLSQFAFPYDQDFPATSLEGFLCLKVSPFIPTDFFLPKCFVSCRHCRAPASGVSVPKASVHENHFFAPRENQIRATRQRS